MLCIILANIIAIAINYIKLCDIGKAIFSSLKIQFVIIIAVILLWGLIKYLIHFFIPKYNANYIYSTTNAIMVLMFFASLIFTLFISIAGIPVKPINIQIDGTNIVMGTTKAVTLLDDGFTF